MLSIHRPITDIPKWDLHYRTHEIDLLKDQLRCARWKKVSAQCVPPVLDIGGGISGLEDLLPGQVTVLDCSSEAIRFCKNGIVGDALNLQFKNHEFGTCTLIEIIEHFDARDSLRILENAKRAAEYRVIVTVPNSTLGHPDMVPKSEKDHSSNYFHHQVFYPDTLHGFLTKVFKKVSIFSDSYIMAVCYI